MTANLTEIERERQRASASLDAALTAMRTALLCCWSYVRDRVDIDPEARRLSDAAQSALDAVDLEALNVISATDALAAANISSPARGVRDAERLHEGEPK